jgi:hypothetical protein
MGSRHRKARPSAEPTHVALLHHRSAGTIEPAAVQGVVIVGTPVELRAAFGARLAKVADLALYVGEWDQTITVAQWLAA